MTFSRLASFSYGTAKSTHDAKRSVSVSFQVPSCMAPSPRCQNKRSSPAEKSAGEERVFLIRMYVHIRKIALAFKSADINARRPQEKISQAQAAPKFWPVFKNRYKGKYMAEKETHMQGGRGGFRERGRGLLWLKPTMFSKYESLSVCQKALGLNIFPKLPPPPLHMTSP